MDSYTELAACYDLFMDDTPYEDWLEYVLKVFDKYKVPRELVLDLGCGTGTFTKMLAKEGYDMIGIDASSQMLQEAMAKEDDEENILWLLQDMREFELYGTVRAVVSICDSVNYLLTDEDVVKTFKLVENYLDKDGIFVFDFNTDYKYREVIGDCTIAENREEYSFIWENFYNESDHINEYDLTIFTKTGDLYKKSFETHYQRGYSLEEMCMFLKEAGLKVLENEDADTHEEAGPCSERIHIVAQCIRPKQSFVE